MDDHRHLKELKQAAPYVAVYAMFWACVHLKLYWDWFGIKAFQYIGTAEVVSQVADLFMFGCIIIVIFAAVESVARVGASRDYESPVLSKTGWVFSLVIVVVFASAIYYFQNPTMIYTGVGGVSGLLIHPVSRLEMLKHSFSNRPVRVAVAAFLVSFPMFSVVIAYSNSHAIISGKGSYTMIRQETGLCASGCALIGHINEYYALRSGDGAVHMIHSDEMKSFEIFTSEVTPVAPSESGAIPPKILSGQ